LRFEVRSRLEITRLESEWGRAQRDTDGGIHPKHGSMTPAGVVERLANWIHL